MNTYYFTLKGSNYPFLIHGTSVFEDGGFVLVKYFDSYVFSTMIESIDKIKIEDLRGRYITIFEKGQFLIPFPEVL